MDILNFIMTVEIDKVFDAFVRNNWLTLVATYVFFKSMFPNSKFLKAIGDAARAFRTRRGTKKTTRSKGSRRRKPAAPDRD